MNDIVIGFPHSSGMKRDFSTAKPMVAAVFICLLCSCSMFQESEDEMTKSKSVTEQELGPYVSEGLNRSALTNREVLRAMSRVPRHRFVPKNEQDNAYEDKALPIGWQQTISQPYIVALMTQEAQVGPGSKVLEVGTGSGYQAAVLSELGGKVFSVEIVPELAEQAKLVLAELGYERVHVRVGDGWQGWQEEAPFDAILVTASAPRPPATLFSQLAEGGRLVIPLEGEGDEGETLMLYERMGEDVRSRKLGSVRFVPLTGEAREDDETDE